MMKQQLSLFGVSNQAASWIKADPVLMERKASLVGGPSGWRPNRLILMNYWLYDYEEFHFVHGRLVARGANASGKSTVLAAAITLTLDGEKRRERMDTFGGQGRSVAYYLVGDPKASPDSSFYHHDRTGYVVMEYEHATDKRFVSVGVGLYTSRARPNLDVDFWGFALTDGRRPGIDFALFDETTDGRVPLTERQLRERIGIGGQVTDRQGQYQSLVNQVLFGMPEEEYDDLLKVLVQLRSPKLNKDIKPSDVCGILAGSLPPLDERLLERVTRVIEDIDNQQELLETTRQHLSAVTDLDEKLDRYLNQLAQMAALDYREAHGTFVRHQNRLVKAEEALHQTDGELEGLRQRLASSRKDKQETQARLEVLEQSPAFADETALQIAEADRDRAEKALTEADHALADAEKALDRQGTEQVRLRGEWGGAIQKATQKTGAFQEAVRSAEWPLAEQCVSILQEKLAELLVDGANTAVPPALSALVDQAPRRIALLDEVRKARQAVEVADHAYTAQRSIVAQAEAERDHALNQQGVAEEALDEAREHGVRAVETWYGSAVELAPESTHRASLLQAAQEYPYAGADPAVISDRAIGPLARQRQTALEGQRKHVHRLMAGLEQNRKQVKDELESWMQRCEAEPARRPMQEEARRLLLAAGIPAVPLFAACDFQTDLPAAQAAAMEQALEEAGLLDALIVPSKHESDVAILLEGRGLGDRWIRPSPLSNVETLASVLAPVGNIVPPVDVLAALQSVGMDWSGTLGEASIQIDGRWRMGPLVGMTAGHEDLTVRYLGAENRRRHREQEILRLQAELKQLENELDGLASQESALTDRVVTLYDELDQLRRLEAWTDLASAARELKLAQERTRRCQDRVTEETDRQQALYRKLIAVKAELQVKLDAVPECRGRTAAGVVELRNATERLRLQVDAVLESIQLLSRIQADWKRADEAVRIEQGRRDGARERKQKAAEEVDRFRARAEALLERLVGLGIEQLREEIRALRERRDELDRSEKDLLGYEGKFAERRSNEDQQVDDARRNAKLSEQEYTKARIRLMERLRTYPTLQRYVPQVEADTEGALACVDDLLRLRRTGPEGLRGAIDEGQREAYRFLSQAYTDYKSLLVEYKPDLSGDMFWFQDLGARLLPCELRERLRREHEHQQLVVREKENELYEDFILRQVASHIRELVNRVEEWKGRINDLLEQRELSNREVLGLDWKPKPPDRVTGVDMGRVVELLRQDVDKLRREQVDELIQHFRARVDEVRQREKRGEQETSFADALEKVLDYRLWFEFSLYTKVPGQPRQQMTDIRFTARSGAEKSLAMFIPLLAAANARYDTARHDAPRIVGLDEAFAGVDERNTQEMFRFLVELDFCWIMTSEKLWGVGEALPGCATYEIIRQGQVVMPVLYLWDGASRLGSLEGIVREAAGSHERT